MDKVELRRIEQYKNLERRINSLRSDEKVQESRLTATRSLIRDLQSELSELEAEE